MTRSLRKTLVIGTSLAATLIFVAAGVLLDALVRSSLIREFDRSLLNQAILFTSTIELKRGKVEFDTTELDLREFAGNAAPAYLQIWDADGSTLYRSREDGDLGFAPFERGVVSPVVRRLTLPGRGPARAVTIAVHPRVDEEERTKLGGKGGAARDTSSEEPARVITLTLARITAPIRQTLLRLESSLLLVGFLAIAACGIVLDSVVRRSLRPLERLARQISDRDERNLTEIIDSRDAPREVQPLVDRLNDLLRRLSAAFERERAFSANVAHELRNPLAGLRLKMDVVRSRVRQPHEYEHAIDDCRWIASQMHNLVDKLLSLARFEAGQAEVRTTRISLTQLVQESWQRWEPIARDRKLAVEWDAAAEVSVTSDGPLLRTVIDNVLENAVTHADPGGTVKIGVYSAQHGGRLAVSNTGSTLAAADAERVFDRFWRGDPARSDAGVHCGLGLPLTQTIVKALGGTISVQTHVGGEFAMEVAIPRDDRSSSFHVGSV